MSPADTADRKARLVAQCDLDRMRLTHALLVTRLSMSPMAALRASPLRSFAAPAVAFAVPLLLGARRVGFLRVASLALAALRALRSIRRT